MLCAGKLTLPTLTPCPTGLLLVVDLKLEQLHPGYKLIEILLERHPLGVVGTAQAVNSHRNEQ
jgi:hypothetical protein